MANKLPWTEDSRKAALKSLRANIASGKTKLGGHKHSEETKEKLRQKFFENVKKRKGNSTWEKRNRREMSGGEKVLHKLFIKHGIYDLFLVENEFPLYPYFIDFAFINEKVAVEFDGAFHEKRKAHDEKRDKILLEQGWRTFRIPARTLKDFRIEHLLEFLHGGGNR